jgi:hypothetical protein
MVFILVQIIHHELKPVCKHKGVQVFKNRFIEICTTLEYFVHNGKPKERAEAKGLLLQLKSVTIVFFTARV